MSDLSQYDTTLDEDTSHGLCTDWFRVWHQIKGWPDDYLVFNTQTTGLDVHRDLIVEVGIGMVEKRQLVYQTTVVLDWTQEPSVDQAWLAERLQQTRSQV